MCFEFLGRIAFSLRLHAHRIENRNLASTTMSAYDVQITQRADDDSGYVVRIVAPTAGGLFVFDTSKHPQDLATSATAGAPLLSSGAAAIPAFGAAIAANSLTALTSTDLTLAAGSGNQNILLSYTGSGYILAGTPLPISIGFAGSNDPIFQLAGNQGETGLGVYSFYNDNGLPAILRLFKSNNSTIGGHGAVMSGANVGQVSMYASDGTNWCRVAAIRAYANGTVSSLHIPGDLAFLTSTDNSFNEVLRLTSGKQMLFGTASVLPTIAGGTSPLLQIANASAAAKIGLYGFGADANSSVAVFEGYKSRGAAVGTQGAVSSQDNLAQLSGFGSDGTNFIRGGALRIIATSTFAAGAGTADVLIMTSTANAFVETARFKSDLTTLLAGSITTGAPISGTAAAWRGGIYVSTAPTATGYVQLDIGGTLYKLLAST
jgi:hypothetical protein